MGSPQTGWPLAPGADHSHPKHESAITAYDRFDTVLE
jgi:hypothetical protein